MLSALLTLLLAVAAVAVAMSHYCRSRYDLVAILKTLGAGLVAAAQAYRRPMAAAVDAVGDNRRGGGPGAGASAAAGSQTGAARRVTRCQRLAVAVGYRGDRRHFLLVGLRPYRLLLATLPLRVLRQDVVANVWPLKIWIPAVSVVVVGLLAWLLGGSPLLWSVLAGRWCWRCCAAWWAGDCCGCLNA